MYSNTHLHAYLLYRSGLFHFLPFSSLLFSCLYLAGCLVDTEASDEMRVYSILHSVQYCLKIHLRFTVQFNGRHEVEAFLSDTRHEVGCRWTLAGQPVYITKWIYKGGMKMLHILYTVHHHMCVMTQQCACSLALVFLLIHRISSQLLTLTSFSSSSSLRVKVDVERNTFVPIPRSI